MAVNVPAKTLTPREQTLTASEMTKKNELRTEQLQTMGVSLVNRGAPEHASAPAPAPAPKKSGHTPEDPFDVVVQLAQNGHVVDLSKPQAFAAEAIAEDEKELEIGLEHIQAESKKEVLELMKHSAEYYEHEAEKEAEESAIVRYHVEHALGPDAEHVNVDNMVDNILEAATSPAPSPSPANNSGEMSIPAGAISMVQEINKARKNADLDNNTPTPFDIKPRI